MTFKQIFRRFGFSAILLIAGLAFLITGIIKIVNVNTYPQTTAVITYVNYEEGIGDESSTYEVRVKYTVDGTTYEEELDTYKGNFEVGKQITVRYNPKNPSEVTGLGTGTSLIIAGFGAVCVLGSVVALIKPVNR